MSNTFAFNDLPAPLQNLKSSMKYRFPLFMNNSNDFHPITRRMVKHTLKILQHLLQDF